MQIIYPWKFIIIALVINTFFLYFCVNLLKSRRLCLEISPKREQQIDRKSIAILFLIIAIGFSLRIWKLGQENFETQELSYLFPSTKGLSLLFTTSPVNIKNVILHPANLLFFHAPLPSLLLYFLSFINKSVVTEEFLFRFPSVLFGVATIWIIFLLARELFGKKTALLASFLFALSPFHLYYSRSLEPYSALCFFATVSYYLFVLIFFKNRHVLAPIYLILLIFAYFYHYLSVLILGSHFLILLSCLLFREWSKYKNYFFLLFPLVFFDGLEILCFFLLLLFFYKNKKKLFTPMEKNLLFYMALMSIFMYVAVLFFPFTAYSYYKGFPRVCETSSYVCFPFNFSNILKPVEFLNVIFGIFPNRLLETGLIIFTLVYFFISLKRKEFYAFIILLIGIVVPLFATLYGYLDFYVYAKGFYGGGYRWNILMLPFLYIIVSYGINLIVPWKLFIKK